MSVPFNPQAVTVGIYGTAEAVKTPGIEGIVDGIGRKRKAVAAVGVPGRIRIIRVHAELAMLVSLLFVEPRGIRPAVVPMKEYKTRPHCSESIWGLLGRER